MRIVVAVTGASGITIAERLLEELRGRHETHVIISGPARDVAKYENVDISGIESSADHVHDVNDMTSALASSSFRFDAMAVVPCSMKTLSSIASGYTNDLIARSAENALKMGWKLIVVPRDTPLSLAAIENMRRIKSGGGIVLPANVAYYTKPKTIDDVTGFITGKILDAIGIENTLYKHWDGLG